MYKCCDVTSEAAKKTLAGQDCSPLTINTCFCYTLHVFLSCLWHQPYFLIQRVYSAISGSLDLSKRFTLFALPGRPVHSDTNSASPGSILARQQLRARAKSLACPPLSIAKCSFIQLSQLGRQCRERKCPIFETVAKGDSNPGLLDCES